MSFRPPPSLKSGPVSRQQADELNRWLLDVSRFIGGFSAAPPLALAFNRGGVQLNLNSAAAAEVIAPYITNAFVSNVCPHFGYVSGILVVESITVEYTNSDGSVVCVTNPTGCCPESGSGSGGHVITDCCPGVPISANLCLTVTSAETAAACMLGQSFPLNNTGIEWTYPTTPNVACPTIACSWVFLCDLVVGTPTWVLSLDSFLQNSAASVLVTCGPPFHAIFSGLRVDFPDGSHGLIGGVITSNLALCQGGSGGSGGGGSCSGVTTTALGKTSICTPSNLLSLSVPVVSGELIVVSVGHSQTAFNGTVQIMTLGGVSMTHLASETPVGGDGGSYSVELWVGVAAATGTVSIDLAMDPTYGPYDFIVMNAVAVSGLASNANYSVTIEGGGATMPLVQESLPDSGCVYVHGVFLVKTPGGAIVWGSDLTTGGQDVTACSPYTLTEGYKIVVAASQNLDAKLTGITPGSWAGIGAIFF